jgi:hypothetical protein
MVNLLFLSGKSGAPLPQTLVHEGGTHEKRPHNALTNKNREKHYEIRKKLRRTDIAEDTSGHMR